jgi:hypothetical protein
MLFVDGKGGSGGKLSEGFKIFTTEDTGGHRVRLIN